MKLGSLIKHINCEDRVRITVEGDDDFIAQETASYLYNDWEELEKYQDYEVRVITTMLFSQRILEVVIQKPKNKGEMI